MVKPIMQVAGADGQVELLPDRIVIHRKGIFTMLKYGMNASREIPLTSITSVNFRNANFFRTGEVDFDYAGRNQGDNKQNVVKFTYKQQDDFIKLKEKIFDMMNKVKH